MESVYVGKEGSSRVCHWGDSGLMSLECQQNWTWKWDFPNIRETEHGHKKAQYEKEKAQGLGPRRFSVKWRS